MAATGPFTLFHSFPKKSADGTFDLDDLTTAPLKCCLTTTAPVRTWTVYGDVGAAEVANGNGYTTGGAALSTVDFSAVAGAAGAILKAANVQWVGSGAGFNTAAYGVIYRNGTTKDVVGYFALNADLSPVNIAAGTTFSIPMQNGIIIWTAP